MTENIPFHHHQMSEQQIQDFLADGLPLQDFMFHSFTKSISYGGKLVPAQETMIALRVDLSKRPDVQQAFSHTQEVEGEGTGNWIYLHEDQKDACYFVLDVHVEKPVQFQFHIPIRATDALEGDLLDGISLLRYGVIPPLTVYAGPAPDWNALVTQLEPAQVREQLKQDSRGDITLTLTREALRDMSEHYERWCERFQPGHMGHSVDLIVQRD